ELVVPQGASFREVLDTLEARDLVGARRLFTLYARTRGADREIRAGRYRVAGNASWADLVQVLTEGRILPRSITIPEGWTLRQMVPRLAELTNTPESEVEPLLLSAGDSLARELGVPGPGLEGFLFPDTYLFAEGVSPGRVLSTMTEAYRDFWTEARRARLEEMDWTEREVVTLASIIQAEAGNEEEMPLIASVYRNRLEAGWLLQADPTVLYALGGPRDRLLFSAIDSVADDPYNTYTQPGLPPGPIGAPGEAALQAALHPAETDYMYFVAGPDGGHVFSRTLAEHNRAVAEYRRRRASQRGQDPDVQG
ncbi:MAG: endolytic transglycosylase MltG, partial [Gemmatimonadota bacterium]